MIIAAHVKKIKGLSQNFRKKKFLGEFVGFFCYKMAFLNYIIRYRRRGLTQVLNDPGGERK